MTPSEVSGVIFSVVGVIQILTYKGMIFDKTVYLVYYMHSWNESVTALPWHEIDIIPRFIIVRRFLINDKQPQRK